MYMYIYIYIYICVCVCVCLGVRLLIFGLGGRNSEFSLQIGRTAVITLSVAILAISRSARIFDRRRGNRLIPTSHVVPSSAFRSSDQQQVPQFGLPRTGSRQQARLDSVLLSGQAQPPDQQTAPPAASGHWGSGWNRDDRRRRGGDLAAPAAHNPFAAQKPDFVEQVVVEDADSNRNSLLVIIDNRDERLISTSQNWLVDEIMANAASSITGRQEHRPSLQACLRVVFALACHQAEDMIIADSSHAVHVAASKPTAVCLQTLVSYCDCFGGFPAFCG